MQAAVVSVLLMAGVCGAPPGPYDGTNSQAMAQQGYADTASGCATSDGQMERGNRCYRVANDGAARSDGAMRSGTLWSPVTAGGIVTYDVGPLGRPWYSPLWFIHSRATFYPANYAKPYDYREAFGYPWNGPRPAPILPPVPPRLSPEEPLPEPSPTAAHLSPAPADPWPASTAAAYVRQSQSRIASKPVVGSK